jgi:hypothetical protein
MLWKLNRPITSSIYPDCHFYSKVAVGYNTFRIALGLEAAITVVDGLAFLRKSRSKVLSEE